MHVVIAGASGFLGTHLTRNLRQRGHDVTRLVRRDASAPDESTWDPYAGRYDDGLFEQADVVVNLAGAPTAGNPHSTAWARELRDSRVTTTRVLAGAVAGSDRRPAFLAGSGISYYGDHGDESLTEGSDSRGDALLTEVAREWEAATAPAREAGARVCVLRTAPVLDKDNAPFKQMRLAWSLGLGARLGDGRQRFPMISRRDWVGAATFLAEHDTAAGPFNLCCPRTPTNAEFTEALAAALHRKAFLRAPRRVLELAAGQMAPELLGSVDARPEALLEAGYGFADEDVAAVLAAALA